MNEFSFQKGKTESYKTVGHFVCIRIGRAKAISVLMQITMLELYSKLTASKRGNGL